ncbi:MAG: polysaccharide biosynthesis tyrosine autokinase [Vicingaceae bacterium]|nr:polysaccharide biosynthesis tyrosine autokinase [Vicingaceae bacterium]
MQEEQFSNKREPISNFNTELDIILLLKIFKRNLFLFIAIITICVIVSFVYLRYTVPIYQSQLVLQVGSENTANKVLQVDNFSQKEDIAKDVELLKSKLLFKRALSKLPLKVSYYNQGNFLNNELYVGSPMKVNYAIKDSSIVGVPFFIEITKNNKFNLFENETLIGEFEADTPIKLKQVDLKIQIDEYESIKNIKNNKMLFVINNIDDLTSRYISQLNIFPLNPSAKTINISFQDNNSTKAKDIVTSLANEYILYDLEERSKSSKKVIEFLDDQLDKYYNRVKLSENKIQDFQSNNKIGNPQEFSSIYLDRINRFENQLIDIDFQRNVLTEISKSVSGKLNTIDVYNLMPTLTGTEYEASISALITNLQGLLVQKQNLLGEVTVSSEASKSLDRKIEIQKEVLFATISSLVVKLDSRRKEVTRRIEEIQSKYLNVPANELEYARLQRVLSIDEKFFTLLMEKRTEYSISEAGFVPQQTILDKAVVSSIPVSPNKKIILATGVLLGVVISLVLLILKYVFKNTISSIDEINRYAHSSAAFLGNIPIYSNEIPVSQLVIDKEPKSVIAEAFRSVRSNLQFISNDENKKIIAITSTISGEGKTFCAINLAGILALSGKKVIIIDLDMRRPKIHIGFGVKNTFGMSTLLINRNTIEECIHHSELENLDFITSGPTPPNPAELIISGELEKVIEKLKKQYDYIMIDNPPIGLVSDAMETLKKADYPIYVFKNEYSRKNFINNIDKLILENGIKKLAIILNAVDFKDKYYSYGYNYSYSYGQKNGYYYDSKEKETSMIENILKKLKLKK